MHFSTLAVAATALFTSALAAPAPEVMTYQWKVTKWSFSRGQSAYDYSFKIRGAANGATPAFNATCAGTQMGGYKACGVGDRNGPMVMANVNVVQDPSNENNNIPQVFVQTTYTDKETCRYVSTGNYYATLNGGSKKGSKFNIAPKNTAVC